MIGTCGRLFQKAEGMNDFTGHGFNADTDREVFVTALGLSCPQPVCRNADLSHGVVFNAIIVHNTAPVK